MRFTIGLIFTLAVGSAQAAPPEPLPSVADPRYGVALYHYYLDDHWNALTELMIAEARGGIKGHGERPAMMKGAFSLAYGMDQRAGEIFARVLDQNHDAEIRDAAWFYLAKMRYLRGDWSGAAEALAQLGQEPPEGLAGELRALRVNIAIQQGDLDRAARLLPDEAAEGDVHLPYLLYNLGAARSRAGDYVGAIELYNRLAELPLRREEHLALYDRAMTAAGYSYLRGRQLPEAQAQFSRVRLGSPLSGSAMLGYGWAAAEQQQFLDALTPWQHLSQSSRLDENAQEALLAVPYAYEQLGNKGMALRHFEQAEQRFNDELETVAQVMKRLGEGSILKALRADGDGSFDWLQHQSWGGLEPQSIYLAGLFARDEFQSQVQELRELLQIRSRLERWQDKLNFYSQLLDEREAARSDRLNELERRQLSEQLGNMRARRDRLAAELARIREQRDYLALASGDQADLRQRVAAMEQNIAALAAAGRDVSDYRDAHRRYAGILLWQASQDFDARLWHVQEGVDQLDQQLAELADVRERLQTVVDSAEDLAPYRQRIARNRARLTDQLAHLDSTIAGAEQNLRSQIAAVLREQQERLRSYLAQARLAIARLYDSGDAVEAAGEAP